jgi:cytochrome P450
VILSGWSRLSHYLTCLDGLLTADKVAREFEFTPLRQRVFSFRDSLPLCLKNAHLAGIQHSRSTGELLVPSIDLTHRNPRVWPEPEKFRPERFLERRPGPYEFFPFGGGIRRCIGMSFALFETKVVLARVLSRCDLRLVPGADPG